MSPVAVAAPKCSLVWLDRQGRREPVTEERRAYNDVRVFRDLPGLFCALDAVSSNVKQNDERIRVA